MAELVKSLNAKCAIKNDGPFDFGIFLDSLKFNNTISTNFPQKLCFSFWWGLHNLSNYVWENFFAIGISIIGLLLFLYLIGNVQTFMSMETEKSEEIRRKIKLKEPDMNVWMERNGVPENLRKEIMAKIREKLEEDKHADVENLFSILPWATKKSLKHVLCISTLRKVPRLQGMNPKVLKMICDYLKPVIYPEHSYVAKMDEPIDRMVLVTEGTMWVYSSSTSSVQRTVEKGEIYGDEQLLSWVSENLQHVSISNVPISRENVKCLTRVEGFSIMAKDLNPVATKCKMYWKYDEEATIGSATIRPPAAAGRGAAQHRPAAAGSVRPAPPPAGGVRLTPHRPAPAGSGAGAVNSPRARIEYLQRR